MATLLYISRILFILSLLSATNALALRSQNVLSPSVPQALQVSLNDGAAVLPEQSASNPSLESAEESADFSDDTLRDLLDALNVMQDEYFELWQGTWPTSIDWTAAVLGTHVSATLSSLSSTFDDVLSSDVLLKTEEEISGIGERFLAFENLINRFFSQTTAFYFGENAISLRGQAFDDMLWVVLGWLESIKFQVLHSDLHYGDFSWPNTTTKQYWHGSQLQEPAAHRARLFHGLASGGWDESLCGGGMIWSPYLTPYKNAITNELYIAASVGMYLYYPGDIIDSPFMPTGMNDDKWTDGYPHHPAHLQAAIEGYKWLNASGMTGIGGLYADGFHIRGWKGSDKPGTRKCDVLNTMVYTYNQGVILSGLRGLWLATASMQYLQDGHRLVRQVIDATGWPDRTSRKWAGLGRGGVLEEICDSTGSCSQNSQTFKGIFFHHLTEFCRPIHPQEARFLASSNQTTEEHSEWQDTYEWHQARCGTYLKWIEHNANAALMTRDEDGKFGMWWGRKYRQLDNAIMTTSHLPRGAIDYRNYGDQAEGSEPLAGMLRGFASQLTDDQSASFEHEKPGLSYPGRTYEQTRLTKVQDNGQVRESDYNDRGRGRTVETQSMGVAVLRALYQWKYASGSAIERTA
ncbi:conserved hypothetical protein [Aspergillus terreus NIH2624]|uniref:Glycosyl hydrolase n=1 Tax=Aspergillus terreus (strain NIH 2624 / FGSC A1156) TaxID=341663 RepID=Q0C9R8_ASPTN|nr:uncharacterized protein ATEG_09566 [Aspergillus terreus NIH2624]EAU29757.1 conserved hypothetical protein [Aspergillus terreus NIH2624]